MSLNMQDALQRTIEHREIFHDEMLALMRNIMSGEATPVMIAALTVGLRVKKETMDSSSLIGLDAKRADYKVENVRWTQYFSADGKALHENYWKPRDEFGIPSSHGCAGLVAEDARFFWNWADVGVPVIAHY